MNDGLSGISLVLDELVPEMLGCAMLDRLVTRVILVDCASEIVLVPVHKINDGLLAWSVLAPAQMLQIPISMLGLVDLIGIDQ